MKPVQFAHIHTTEQYRAAMGCQDLQAPERGREACRTCGLPSLSRAGHD
jgi:hypothetical protein